VVCGFGSVGKSKIFLLPEGQISLKKARSFERAFFGGATVSIFM
jgi:hypothetical protein